MRRLLKSSLAWVGLLFGLTALLWQPLGVVRVALDAVANGLSLDTDLVAQIVPAIVVAIFVFAVGTAFVVAQVGPPARGTRAVAVLQGRRLIGTISPTLALLLGSAYVVTGSVQGSALPAEREVAAVVLVGALVYTGFALVALTSVLVDATDPAQFKHFLLKKARRAMERLVRAVRCPEVAAGQSTSPDAWERWFAPIQVRSMKAQPSVVRERGAKDQLHDIVCTAWGWVVRQAARINHRRQLREQRATDDLYGIVRTARGWVRQAARTNDSRELQEALETFLSLVQDHADLVADHGRCLSTVPTIYWTHAEEAHELLNPLRDPDSDTDIIPEWHPWTPPKLVTREEARPRFFALPSTWFANEVGRAIVRATELGIEARSLVDRDTFRLLNTLYNSAQLFVRELARVKEEDSNDENPAYLPLEWGAGIMVRCLTEIGLGVRHAPSDRADWYLEPCIRLATLSKGFADLYPETADPTAGQTPIRPPSVRRLSEGAAACCLLVAEAIVNVLDRPDGPPSTERKHAYQILRKQIANLDTDARNQVAELVNRKIFAPRERLARHDPDLTRLSPLGWTNV